MLAIENSTLNAIDSKVNNVSRDKKIYKFNEKNFFKDSLREKVSANPKNKIKDRVKSVSDKAETKEKNECISNEEDRKEPLTKEELESLLNTIYQLLYGKNHLDNTQKFDGQLMEVKEEEINDFINKNLDNLLDGLAKLNKDDSDDLAKLKLLFKNEDSLLISQNDKENLLKRIQMAIEDKILMNEETINQKDLIKFISGELEKELKDNVVSNKSINDIEYPKNKIHIDLEEQKSSKEISFLEKLIENGEGNNGTKNLDMKINKFTNLGELNNLNPMNKNVSLEVKESTTITKSNMIQDMVKNVKYMEFNNLKNLTVKIMPKELGEIVIRLTMEQGKMKLDLNATTKETFNLLNSNLEEFSEKLNNVNIKIQPSEINIYNEDTTFFSGEFMGENSRQGDGGRNYNEKISSQNVMGDESEEENNLNENYSGNLNAKV